MNAEQLHEITRRLSRLPSDAEQSAIYQSLGGARYLAASHPQMRIGKFFEVLEENVAAQEKQLAGAQATAAA